MGSSRHFFVPSVMLQWQGSCKKTFLSKKQKVNQKVEMAISGHLPHDPQGNLRETCAMPWNKSQPHPKVLACCWMSLTSSKQFRSCCIKVSTISESRESRHIKSKKNRVSCVDIRLAHLRPNRKSVGIAMGDPTLQPATPKS